MSTVIEPGGVHAGAHDGDDIEDVAGALMSCAVSAEAAASECLAKVALALGGQLDRLATRLKARESVIEKLEKWRKADPPHYRLERFNDALRYTVVIPDLIYWRAARSCSELLAAEGFEVMVLPQRWRTRNYKGLNLTVRGPDGFDFEIQLHTPRSVAAAELTHELYAEQRRLPVGSPRYREVVAEAARAWSLVPVPPGASEVP